jgi:alditol oxidase
MNDQTNWAGNYKYLASRIHRPETVEQLQELVARSRKVKALGTRHSFNNIADTSEDLISMEHFDQVVSLNSERRTVTVEGGIKYGQLCSYLAAEGFALHNMASLPHISVAGACATATHGSGIANGNLATAVSGMEMVIANGELIKLTRESEVFDGAVVHLGALGIVAKLTLDILPAFSVRQHVYENLPLAHLEDHFDEIMSRAYSVSMFTDWTSSTIDQIWVKSKVEGDDFEAEPDLFDAPLATTQLHPLKGMPAENCTEQLGVCGSWDERLPHFRMEFTPSGGEELQSEYFVSRENAFPALSAIDNLREHLAPLTLTSEIRTIAADTLWMSPCYERASVAFHFTWKKDWPAVSKVLPMIEEVLKPFDARPHWGKLFTMSPAKLQSLYESLADFRGLMELYDPRGKFRNQFLESMFE